MPIKDNPVRASKESEIVGKEKGQTEGTQETSIE